MNIAILGFGTVGTGVYDIIKSSVKDIKVTKILDLPSNKDKLDIITCDINDILQDDSIDLVVETMGGLHPAYEYITQSLKAKKNVVSANKAVIAVYFEEFIKLANENNVKFSYEASVGGGISCIYNIARTKRIDNIDYFYGILNGTSNFILDAMYNQNKEFDEVLSTAQKLGYAEADPSADIDGYDVQNKIAICCAVAFDSLVDLKDISRFSLRNITKNDIEYLKQNNNSIKYLAKAVLDNNVIQADVMLNILDKDTVEANVNKNFNIISVSGNSIGELKFYGQGAGKLPTGNAIVQDILDIKNNDKSFENKGFEVSDELSKDIYLIRTNKLIQNDFIEKIEEYNSNYYMMSKAITMKTLKEIVNKINDEKILVAKYF